MAEPAKSSQAATPGHAAGPHELLALANEFARAAERLHEIRRKGKPLSQAPFRLAAIHAIELYLNAVLLSYGVDAKDVRGLQHDLSKRLASAKDAGLKLGARTVMHIDKLTETQEYLKARYAPHESANLSPLNRLQQTLKEVREQALAIVDRSEAPVAVHKTSAGNK